MSEHGEPLQDMGFHVEFTTGPNDGEKFKLVRDENGQTFYVSDSRPGKFKQVFVPIEVEHPGVIT